MYLFIILSNHTPPGVLEEAPNFNTQVRRFPLQPHRLLTLEIVYIESRQPAHSPPHLIVKYPR